MIRTLATLAAFVALTVTAQPAAAFTPPIGTDKGSAVGLIVYNGHAGLGGN
jgi:hypothetical protein